MVALTIVAIALAAGLKASAALAFNAQRQLDITFGLICAKNQLIELRLLRQMPAVGETTAPCHQAGQTYTVRVVAGVTPNANFMRVQAQVFKLSEPIVQITTVQGRN